MTSGVLFVADGPLTASLAPALRSSCTVAVTSTIDTGRESVRRVRPALVVVDMDMANGSTAEICREAKAFHPPAAVLVTASAAEQVPEALEAGCDSVLLKPFQPNLFYARVGRLLRERGKTPGAGTNRACADTTCPRCQHDGVTHFEFASHRRAWYACQACRHVWLGKMPD